MADDWEVTPLGELIEPGRGISYGIVQPGPAVPGGVPIVRVSDVGKGRISTDDPLRVSAEIESSFHRTRLRGGELLLTIVGTVGESAVVPDALAGWNTARAVAVIPVRPDVGAYWIRLALHAPVCQSLLGSRLNTTVQATLNLRDVAELPIILPPPRERARLTSILGTLDDKIELNRRMNETLEGIARELFKSWFVDFDPVRAKAEGRDTGLPREIADLFPDGFEESELGEIPRGWRVGSFGDVAEHPRRGIRPREIDASTPYIGLEHMPRRCIALSGWGTADELESNKFQFRRGEVLFGKLRPYFHKVGVAPVDGVCSTDIVVVTARTEEWFGFVLGHASSGAFVDYANAGATGTKMPRTSWTDMARYAIALPPDGLAAAFSYRIHKCVSRILVSVKESRNLATLRDTLLPKLLSGAIRVKDAERAVEEVA